MLHSNLSVWRVQSLSRAAPQEYVLSPVICEWFSITLSGYILLYSYPIVLLSLQSFVPAQVRAYMGSTGPPLSQLPCVRWGKKSEHKYIYRYMVYRYMVHIYGIQNHKFIKVGRDLQDPQAQPCPLPMSVPHLHPQFWITSRDGDPTTPWAACFNPPPLLLRRNCS